MELNEYQEKWLRALESGEYKQGYGWLYYHGYCCIGVAVAVVAGCPEPQGISLVSFPGVVKDLKLRSVSGAFHGEEIENCSTLADLNDVAKWTFPKIAAFIRANPERVFLP